MKGTTIEYDLQKLERFVEALDHYNAIFGREIDNIIGEGEDRKVLNVSE